jgi:hypothetical protein
MHKRGRLRSKSFRAAGAGRFLPVEQDFWEKFRVDSPMGWQPWFSVTLGKRLLVIFQVKADRRGNLTQQRAKPLGGCRKVVVWTVIVNANDSLSSEVEAVVFESLGGHYTGDEA